VKQTNNKQYLVVTEIVAEHESIDDRINLFIVEEVDALNTAGTITNVTIKLSTTHCHRDFTHIVANVCLI